MQPHKFTRNVLRHRPHMYGLTSNNHVSLANSVLASAKPAYQKIPTNHVAGPSHYVRQAAPPPPNLCISPTPSTRRKLDDSATIHVPPSKRPCLQAALQPSITKRPLPKPYASPVRHSCSNSSSPSCSEVSKPHALPSWYTAYRSLPASSILPTDSTQDIPVNTTKKQYKSHSTPIGLQHNQQILSMLKPSTHLSTDFNEYRTTYRSNLPHPSAAVETEHAPDTEKGKEEGEEEVDTPPPSHPVPPQQYRSPIYHRIAHTASLPSAIARLARRNTRSTTFASALAHRPNAPSNPRSDVLKTDVYILPH
ncbi:hypothetical protein CC78DRAFT_582999 [Lojkania enalia]|uniref:Uncharacterized protein n=1 Tax=Lojkania enalia TaxID=147567 RepID=A0A9P4N7H6_9PLEO|nr:hypothetical protein CC78DRAFT_582999 [Didymosphaeria enalia]